MRHRVPLIGLACLLVMLLPAGLTSAAPAFFTPWTPLFRGVDQATGTNYSTDPIFAHALRIDLTEPGVQLLATPKTTNFPGYEVLGMSVSNFVKTYKLQVGINANDFNNTGLNEGEPAILNGLSISKGVIVSPQDSSSYMASILFTTSNVPFIVLTNAPPGTNTSGIYSAITGMYPLVWNGTNMCLGGVVTGSASDSGLHQKQPRTTVGYSQDKHYLYLICIDGRQMPFSNGATDQETADTMILFGVYNGVSMDGGGSATMVRADNFGLPLEMNRSSDSLGNGRERVVGSHFGVFAQPLPGFINDLVSAPLYTNATITWTTISNSTSQVEYGTTTNLGTFSTLNPALVTNHSVTLTGLTSGTLYYFRVISLFNGSPFYATSSITTVSLTTYTPLFDLTKPWKWNTNNLNGTDWTARTYNDSTWNSGPGLLYVESIFSSVTPRNTALPPNNGVQLLGVAVFQTYYFRTQFTYTNGLEGAALIFSNYIDDGAVFYLNGVEIQRIRMPNAPTNINNATVATGTPVSGDATVPDVFTISGNLITNLVNGTNVLAVEVHQVPSPGNGDVVFGAALIGSITVANPPSGADLVSSSLAWNTTQGGIDFRYSVQNGPLNTATTAKLFWASGTTIANILSSTPIFTQNIPAGSSGQSATIHVPGTSLRNAPNGTTHLLLVVDPDNLVTETNENNNTIALPDTILNFNSVKDASAVSYQTKGVLTELYRQAGQAQGWITSTARTPQEQAEAMFDNMLANKSPIYAAPGERVKAVYTTMTQGMSRSQIMAARAQILAAMLAQINTEGPGNVSKHCADLQVLNVVDLGYNKFTTTSSRLRFVEAACADSRLSRFLAPTAYKCTLAIDPTYHLEFPQTAGASLLATGAASNFLDDSDVAKEAHEASAFKKLSSLGLVDSGIVSNGHVEFSFTAKENDTLGVVVRATQIFPGLQATNDDSMVFLFDAANKLVASNDDDETTGLSASLNAVTIPASGSYKLVITTFPNTPNLSGTGILESWNDNGGSSIAFEVEAVLVSALPHLDLHRLENNQLLLEWEGNEILQEADSPVGTWTDNTAVSSPHITSMNAANKFYRLRRP